MREDVRKLVQGHGNAAKGESEAQEDADFARFFRQREALKFVCWVRALGAHCLVGSLAIKIIGTGKRIKIKFVTILRTPMVRRCA